MNNGTKKITTLAMISAIAYVMVLVGRIPVVMFLKYDPKDIIITMGGLIWGPMASFIVSVIVSLIEMVTISENGVLGCIMNIVSTCPNAMKTRSIDNLAIIDKNVKSMLLIKFLNMVINPKTKRNTSEIKISNLIFLNNNLF